MVLPSWVREAETRPAPMPLLLVQSLVNTWEADSGTDVLDEPDSARQWLAQAGLADGQDDHTDLAEVRAVRESIRAVLVRNGGGPVPDAADLAPLRRLAERSPLQPDVLDDGEIALRPAPGVGAVGLAGILLIIRDAQNDGTWHRLKACRNPECRWAYYDRSHAGRGAWCDMAVCGNRIKNRNLRSRRSGAAEQP
jgi:predicted RNA-binding Zn ribbon-like protein